MKNKILALITAAIMIFSATACSSKEETPPSPDDSTVTETEKEETGDSISLIYYEDDTLNPYKCKYLQSMYLGGLLYEGLTYINTENEVENALAHEITQNDNIFVVSLKNGVHFSNGDELTADDIIYSFNKAKNHPSYSAMLRGVENVEAASDKAVIFTLSSPDIYFPKSLFFPVISKKTDRNGVPYGTGRFILSDDGKTLTQSDRCSKEARIKTINLVPAESTDYALLDLMEEKIDLLYSDLQNEISLGHGINFRQVLLSNLVYVGANPSYVGTVMRDILSQLMPRETITHRAYSGFAQPAALPINPMAALSPITTVTEILDRDEIFKNLSSIGYIYSESQNRWYRNGTLLDLDLVVPKDNTRRMKAAEIIKEEAEDYGIVINIVPVTDSNFLDRVKYGNYELYLGEIKMPYNMDLSALGFTAYIGEGVDTYGDLPYIYRQVKQGLLPQSELEKSLLEHNPVIPIAFRRGIICFSRYFSSNIVATEQDIFYNIEEW